jgi:hypothetical protein
MNCPNCQTPMELKGSWLSGETTCGGEVEVDCLLWQCPKCKNVEITK